EDFNLEIYKPDPELIKIYNEKKLEDKVGVIDRGEGSLPVLWSNGKGLAEAWENSLISLWMNGCVIHTEYDEKQLDGSYLFPPSKDCSMIMVVKEPLSEPMIHRSFPGGLEDLEEYVQEVLYGIKNHWIRDPNDPEDQRWEYTYHERYRKYRVPGLEETIDQHKEMVERLAKSPISRRAQMVLWQPWIDSKPEVADPPCWQSWWARLPRYKKIDENNKAGMGLEMYYGEQGVLYLNVNMRFRSRDAFDAAFMNCFAFAHLMEKMANEIAEKRGEEVKLGRFLDMSDSYHIYGKRADAFVDGFIKQLKTRSFEERTWTKEFAQPIFDEAKPRIAEKIGKKDEEDEKDREQE
ncbi:thymidylate synthase, partial [Candidatus Woesearchaeota archaeon]|nr:thymidylate synthase [Candidatus Woesearchaeota archaeon]